MMNQDSEMRSRGAKVHKRTRSLFDSKCPTVLNSDHWLKYSWFWKGVTCRHCLKRKKDLDWKKHLRQLTKRLLADLEKEPVPKEKPAKVGSRVEILTPIAGIRHRRSKNGKITEINGGYVYVRPSWCTWEVELYHGEFRVL